MNHLLLRAKFILPIHDDPIEDGGVLISDEGKIVAIGSCDDIRKKFPSVKEQEFHQHVLMPGLVNAHTHLDLLSFQGTGESPQFMDWILGFWAHRRKQTLSDRRQCLEQGFYQLLHAGITTVGDVGQFFGLISQVVNHPIRAVLFPELITGGDPTIQDSYEAIFTQLEEIMGQSHPRVTAGLAPFAPYTLSKHLLKIIAQQAHDLKIPLKIHVSETFAEMQFFYESSGEIADRLFPHLGWEGQLPPAHRKTPVQYLESIGFLDARPTLVGGNQLSNPDIDILAKTGCKLVHAPRSNAHLKLGHPPLKKLREMRVPIGLGTDTCAAIFTLSIWDEMRYINDHYPDAERPSPRELLSMATIEGAKCLGVDRFVGTLEPGKNADLIAVHVPRDLDQETLQHWLVSQATHRDVEAVWIEGQSVKL